MRLLKYDDTDNYRLTPDLPANETPPYAILSHTWGPDEVIFPDLQSSESQWQEKEGYQKIQFCAEQAKRHGLRHFWVDTCCIDKSNSIELQTAINSMFRWYRDAVRCHVYMADVSSAGTSDKEGDEPWRPAFQNSRWFTRGWTLQELIAPRIVEFYSKEGVFLGDKRSLEYILRDITAIPAKALRGSSLSEFTITERESWVRNRQTKYEEDMAYSLLGIFNVFLPLIYGEGRFEAQRRLREEVQRAARGVLRNDFSITFSLSEVPEVQNFVARGGELAEIRKMLISDGSRRVVVLHGLGGIGKTQLAVAYLKRHRDDYSAIFWLNIKDEHSIKQSFVKIAKQIRQQHPDAGLFSEVGDDSGKAVEAVKLWLSLPGNTRWLAVYDNYDEAKVTDDESGAGVDINKFLPTAHQGAIIITTRLSLIDMGHVIRVKKLESMADSLEILTSTSGRANLREDPDARKLVEKLDGLPLALATAGAYLRRVAMKPADYLRHYDRSWTRLHESTPNLGSYKDRTLCSTWQVSYQQIEDQTPLAAELLKLWAYFDNQDLWFELLTLKGGVGPRWFHELDDELTFNETMATLHDYGFVEPCTQSLSTGDSQGYSIHGCLHSWAKHVLNRARDPSLGRLAVECVASCVPTNNAFQCLRLRRRLLSHAKVSFSGIQEFIGDMEESVWILGALGSLYSSQDMFKDVEDVFASGVQGFERKYGLDDVRSLYCLARLAQAYSDQNRMKEAEDTFLRTIRGQEKVSGADHPLTIFPLEALASLYTSQHRFAEAEAIYKRSVDLQEALWGLDHPHRLASLRRMAQLYSDQRELEKAEQILSHILERFEATQRRGCQLALWTLSELGYLYLLQMKLPEAEKVFLQALDGTRKLLGPDHTDALDAMTNLAYICEFQGKLQEAEAMCQEAVRGYEAALGRGNRTTAQALVHLASIYSLQGRHEDAEKIYLGVLEETEKAWGPDHEHTISAVQHLGHMHHRQGHSKEAENMYRRALDGWDAAYGANRVEKLALAANLGIACMTQGGFGEAGALFTRALRGYEESMAPAHFAWYRTALSVIVDVAGLRLRQRRYNEAREYYQRAHDDFRAYLEPDNNTVRRMRTDLRRMDRYMRDLGSDDEYSGPGNERSGERDGGQRGAARSSTEELEELEGNQGFEESDGSSGSDADSVSSMQSEILIG